MTEATKRSIFRWVHIICGIPILGTFMIRLQILTTTPPVRYFFLPMLLLSGLWMWKGHVVRRLISRRVTGNAAA